VAFGALDSNASSGLTAHDARSRLERDGANDVPAAKHHPLLRQPRRLFYKRQRHVHEMEDLCCHRSNQKSAHAAQALLSRHAIERSGSATALHANDMPNTTLLARGLRPFQDFTAGSLFFLLDP
jgi:hypothetical protein